MKSNGNLIKANAIGNDLARQYYKFLTDDPTSLHLFYNNDHVRSFPDLDKRREIIYKKSEIHQKVISKGHKQNSTIIKSTVCHTTLQDSILVQIFGKISHGGPGRQFMQTFIIARENEKYYVSTDTFSYVDEMISVDTLWTTDDVDEDCMTVVYRAQTPSVPNTPPPAKNDAEPVPSPPTKSPEVPKPKKKSKPRKKQVDAQPTCPAPTSSKAEEPTPAPSVAKIKKETPTSSTDKGLKTEVKDPPTPKTWAGLMANCTSFNTEPPKKDIDEPVPEKKPNGKARPATNGKPKAPFNGKPRVAFNGTAGPTGNGRPRTAANGTSGPVTNGPPRPAGNRAFGNSTRGRPRLVTNGTQGPAANGKQRPPANGRHWSSQGKPRPVSNETRQSGSGPKESAFKKPQVNGTEQ